MATQQCHDFNIRIKSLALENCSRGRDCAARLLRNFTFIRTCRPMTRSGGTGSGTLNHLRPSVMCTSRIVETECKSPSGFMRPIILHIEPAFGPSPESESALPSPCFYQPPTQFVFTLSFSSLGVSTPGYRYECQVRPNSTGSLEPLKESETAGKRMRAEEGREPRRRQEIRDSD